MLNYMEDAYFAKGIVAKRVRKLIQIRNHIRIRVRIAIYSNCPRKLIFSAAYI